MAHSGDESSSDEEDQENEKEEEFYTEGDPILEQARRWIAGYSLPRAKKRVARQRQETFIPLARTLDTRKAVFAELKVSLLTIVSQGNKLNITTRYP